MSFPLFGFPRQRERLLCPPLAEVSDRTEVDFWINKVVLASQLAEVSDRTEVEKLRTEFLARSSP